MKVTAVRFQGGPGGSRFAARIEKRGAPQNPFAGYIAFKADLRAPDCPGDPFLAACLLPAMFTGEDLEVESPVSARLVRAIATVQDVFLSWYPRDFRRIRVRAPERVPESPGPGEASAALFFSGGVDSWYSLLKQRAARPALLTVKGFDIPLEDTSVYARLVQAGQEVADEFGAQLLPVETNLRLGLDPGFGQLGKPYPGDFWGPVLHGAFLGAVGLCLQPHFGRVIIPSSYPYDQLFPWGSHPLVDPLWSTELTRMEHDGCEASRTEKVRRVGESATALRLVRVCAEYHPGSYNCGTCEKCVRTLLALRLFGKVPAEGLFSKPLDLRSLELLRLPPSKLSWYRELLAEAETRGQAEIIRVTRILLGRKRSLRRDWALLGQALGIPRHRRSLRKRWNQLRGLPEMAGVVQ